MRGFAMFGACVMAAAASLLLARGGPLAATAAAPAGGGVGAGDAANGKTLFEKRCSGCHAMDHNHEGPRLQGVYGRVSGTVADFAYSDALKKAHVVWDESSLEKWLADPDAFLPGNNMDFLVSAPEERKDLIAYLKQRSNRKGGTSR
jgi:cytochrome c